MKEYILHPWRVSIRVNCHDRFEPLIKHKGNPVFSDDRPWEGRNAWPTVLFIPEENMFKMWYLTIVEGEEDSDGGLIIDNAVMKKNKFYICYAESSDGIEWNRPELNLIKTVKYPGNNILIENIGRYVDGPSVAYDPADPDPSRRYKAAYYEHNGDVMGVRTKVSPDGIHWTEVGDFPVLPSQDAMKMYHDTETNTFYMLLKDRIMNRRSRLVSSSKDFINWSEPREYLAPNLGDNETTNFYDMCMFKNGDITMAFATLFDASTQFSHSELIMANPETIAERFPSRPAAIRPGDLGAWDGGGIYTSSGPSIEFNGKMRFYYYGSSRRHDSYLFQEKYKKQVGERTLTALGFAEYEKGRLCGQQFLGDGSFKTTAILKSGKKLFIDAVIPEDLKVSITRCGYGVSYEGFSGDDCTPIKGDGMLEVIWPGKSLEDIEDKYIRIKVEGKNAIIYGFRFE
ncbi:MAG: hypothetical protein KAH14_10660 [Clostridiales bacterium]|nr:hypothetical protein [Clostridiales bacterium]